MNPEEQFLSHLDLIERIARYTCRRYRCREDEAEEFTSFVKLKLVEQDYAVFQKFAGRSMLSTYLTTVLQRLFLDHRNQRWGKWRPSAEARRRGPEAQALERLMVRDGHTLEEACEVRSRISGETAAKLRDLALQLPMRQRRREVDDAGLDALRSHDGRPDRHVVEEERAALYDRVRQELERAVDALPAEDRLLVKLRTEDGLQVSEIARVMNLPAKPLYPRLKVIYLRLREALEAIGVDSRVVADVLAPPAAESSSLVRVR